MGNSRSIILAMIICTLLGAGLGFGISHLYFQPQINKLQSLSSFEEEVAYYQNQEGYIIDETYTWEEFYSTKYVEATPFVQVSKEQLRFESARYRAYLVLFNWSCPVYVDYDAKVIWLDSPNPYRDYERFIYWWKPD